MIIYELAMSMNRFPWELRNAPAREFHKFLEMGRIKEWASKTTPKE